MSLVGTQARIAFKNILFAADFSESAQAALAVAADFARRHGSRLWLTHVVPPEARTAIPVEAMPLRFDAEWIAAEQDMQVLMESPLLQGIPHQARLKHGDLWPAISEVIAERDIDLIVLGTRGRTGIFKLLLGSVAEEIARLAPCPVLTVGGQANVGIAPHKSLKQILYATDFRPGSLRALEYAFWLAKEDGARLTLLHVTDLPVEPDLDKVRREHERAVGKLVDLVPPDMPVTAVPEFRVEFGEPADVILKVAAESKVDLIVMGARQTEHPHASSHLAWAMTHRVLAHATCPVLTVRG